MTQEEWRQVWNVYESAAGLPAAERGALVQSALPDPALRATVEEMLAGLDAGDSEPAPTDEWPFLGHTLGRFQLHRSIGRGGMGEVYAAIDPELEREVAVKCVAPTNIGSSKAVSDFLREARSASALNHPGIVTIYEVIRTEETVAIVMELVDGVSFRVLASTPQPLVEVAAWGRQIAEALAACHARGIIHRDIKPENLILRKDGYAKILDFGLAADRAAPTESSPIGTVRYMSPEQGRGAPLTPATDIFSLGIVLFELATGVHPFASAASANTTLSLVAAVAGCQADLPSRLRHGIPAGFDQLLREMLAKDARLRPSAAEVVHRLDLIGKSGDTRSHRHWYAVAAAVTLTAAALLFWLLPRAPAIDPSRIQIVPFTTYEGSENQPSFSPDGSKIAFVWTGGTGNNKDIYVKGIADGRLDRLTSDPAEDLLPVFSPDGSHIAFLRQTAGVNEPEVMVMRSDGSDVRGIARIYPLSGFFGLAWWPDGQSLVVRHSTGTPSLFRLTLQNGSFQRITFPPELVADAHPGFSPDGKWLAFIRYSAGGTEVCIQPIAGGADRTLVKGMASDIAWMPDSKSILYSAENALWSIAIDPGARPVRIVSGNFGGLVIDRAGHHIAFSRSFVDANIWSISAEGKDNTRLIASSGEDSSPNWSPDGKHIVMRSNRLGDWELYTYNADGSGEKQITSFSSHIDNPVWSPDGAWIAFDGNRAPIDPSVRHHNIYLVPSGGGPFRRLTDDASHYEIPAWSSDGHWLYYLKEATTGEETWKAPVAGGAPVLVDRNTLEDLVESADGQYLYYVRANGAPGIYRRRISDNQERVLSGTEGVQHFRYWSLTHNGVYFVPGPPDPLLQFLDLRNKRISRVAKIPPSLIKGPRGLAVSPDGSRILYTVEDIVAADIMLGRM